MKRAVLILLLLALRASAVTPPVTDGKNLQLPTLSFDNLPQPTRTQPVSPVSYRRRPPGKTIENRTLGSEMLRYENLSFKVLPQTNFTAKRATVAGTLPAALVQTSRANIENHVIRADSDELKQQLNHPR